MGRRASPQVPPGFLRDGGSCGSGRGRAAAAVVTTPAQRGAIRLAGGRGRGGRRVGHGPQSKDRGGGLIFVELFGRRLEDEEEEYQPIIRRYIAASLTLGSVSQHRRADMQQRLCCVIYRHQEEGVIPAGRELESVSFNQRYLQSLSGSLKRGPDTHRAPGALQCRKNSSFFCLHGETEAEGYAGSQTQAITWETTNKNLIEISQMRERH